MTIFAEKADATIPLELHPNIEGRRPETTRRLRIDVDRFPTQRGVYVVRFDGITISRLNGDSPILKIGKADIRPSSPGYRGRFENYNHQYDLTDPECSYTLATVRKREQQTNAHLMWCLPKLCNRCAIVVDLYDRATGDLSALEQSLLGQYLDQHWELPPLNLSQRR